MALNAGWDEELLRLEIESLEEMNFDLDLLGFDNLELEDLLGEDVRLEEEETLDVIDDEEEVIRNGLICPCCQHKDNKKNFLEVEING